MHKPSFQGPLAGKFADIALLRCNTLPNNVLYRPNNNNNSDGKLLESSYV